MTLLLNDSKLWILQSDSILSALRYSKEIRNGEVKIKNIIGEWMRQFSIIQRVRRSRRQNRVTLLRLIIERDKGVAEKRMQSIPFHHCFSYPLSPHITSPFFSYIFFPLLFLPLFSFLSFSIRHLPCISEKYHPYDARVHRWMQQVASDSTSHKKHTKNRVKWNQLI